MAIGLPSSNLLMSISQIIIGFAWVVDGNYKTKINRFACNKPALIFTSIYVLHLLGLFYTSNFEYAIWDLRNKLPLLVLPFLISSSRPLSSYNLDKVFKVFVATVLVFSVVCAGELTFFNNWVRGIFNFPDREIMDARSISHFISHIRFSLMICLSIAWLAYEVLKGDNTKWMKGVYIAIVIWLTTFLFLMESMTGLMLLISIGLASVLYVAVRQENKIFRFSSLALLLVIPILSVIYVGNMVVDFYHVNDENVDELPIYTTGGEMYFHDLNNKQVENGNYVWRHVCHLEIEPIWEKRSDIPFKGKDKMGQFVEYTLFRYMTSKGLYKDAEGMASLTDEDIVNIENGVANAKYADIGSIESRIYGIIWEIEDYNKEGEPGGHSLSQRWEFWKTGVTVFKNNLLIGVGTGDVYDEMLEQYEKDASISGSKYRKHPHNQYLSIAIGFGLVGLILFLWGILYPVWVNWENLNYISFVFFAILLLSMLTEDTLETQAGVSFIGFFYCLLVLNSREEANSE